MNPHTQYTNASPFGLPRLLGLAWLLIPTAMKHILSYLADSDYAGDKDTRRTTSGFIVPDNHAPLSYRRNTLQLVTPPKKSVWYTIQKEAIRRRHRCGLHPYRLSTRRLIHETNRGPSLQFLLRDRIDMASSVII